VLKGLIGAGVIGLFFLMGSFSTAVAMVVAEGLITTAVVERTPVDAIQSYPVSIGELYCFTRVAGALQGESLTHIWLYEGREMARIDLLVGAGNWRTWSLKTFIPEWKGSWRVDIFDGAGKKLMSIPFTLI